MTANRSEAAGTGHVRHADDFYATPAWLTRAILPHVVEPHVSTVLDPACGDGAILDVVRAAHPNLRTIGIELDSGRASMAGRAHEVVCGDAFSFPPPNTWAADLIVMNPPFALAMEFVRKAVSAQKEWGITVACLLRLCFLASQKRAAFWRANPCDVYVTPRRPSFTADGKTDSADYAWFVFGPGRGGKWAVLDVEARG